MMSSAAPTVENFDLEHASNGCDLTYPNLVSLAEKNEKGFFPLKVSKKEKINHDCYEYVLDFPDPEWTSGVWAGGHMQW